ncbi:MAG TPA: FKBP-type peptidyl-prolyl cis-trans isomerase [Saprospiraceae bacterium]|nr:FKBP-type peptidyl-prolyl cis-trans isomerase [Saprospiraceae bacterium]HNG89494.1 FKBP-type peptidyl-prolyl cis-trans isomerase [Saprospiraceae bacterium]
MRFLTFLLPLCLMLTFSCKKEQNLSPEEQLKADIEDIQNYLKNKGLTAQSTASGLHYIITREGTGDNPTVQSTVVVKYKGYFLNDVVFDQTPGDKTTEFPLQGVIVGWQEAIPLLKVGGKGTFFIPSGLAYGQQGKGSVPPNSPLIFEVELIDF